TSSIVGIRDKQGNAIVGSQRQGTTVCGKRESACYDVVASFGSFFCCIADGSQFGCGVDYKRCNEWSELDALSRQHFSCHFCLLHGDTCQCTTTGTISNRKDVRYIALLHRVDLNATIGSSLNTNIVQVQTRCTRTNAL